MGNHKKWPDYFIFPNKKSLDFNGKPQEMAQVFDFPK